MHRRSNAAGLKSVVHFEVLFFGVDDEVIVDSDLAKFIDDDGVTPAVRLGEDTDKQRGLSSSEIAGNHRNRSLVRPLLMLQLVRAG